MSKTDPDCCIGIASHTKDCTRFEQPSSLGDWTHECDCAQVHIDGRHRYSCAMLVPKPIRDINKETTEVFTTSQKKCNCDYGIAGHADYCPLQVKLPSPAKVEITLTESEQREVVAFGDKLSGTQIGDQILNQVYESVLQLQPSMPEPKGFVAAILAKGHNLQKRELWTRGFSIWSNESKDYRDWSLLTDIEILFNSDLINPRLAGE